MAANNKLTAVIKGRTIASSGTSDGKLSIGFTDGSTLTVKTAPSGSNSGKTGTIKAVQQAGTKLRLELEDGSSWDIETAEETSSVMLRDKNHMMEYAD